MQRLMISLAVLTLAFSLSPTATKAQTDLNISPPASGVVTFTSGGVNTVAMCTSTCTLTNGAGTGFVVGSGGSPIILLGSYTLSFNSASLTLSGTTFSVTGGTATLAYTDASGATGTVTMALQLKLVKDGTPTPQLEGTYLVTTATGNLLPLFSGQNATGLLDVTLILSGCTLEAIAKGTCSTATTGKLLTGSTFGSTPEPSSMLLFGSGLLVVGGILRRRSLRA
jgi:hypothetical protein